MYFSLTFSGCVGPGQIFITLLKKVTDTLSSDDLLWNHLKNLFTLLILSCIPDPLNQNLGVEIRNLCAYLCVYSNGP